MSFNRVCREWRCKYDGDKGTSESLEAIAKVVDELLPEIKKASADATVNRLVCGGCLDFKLMTTVPLEDYGPWEERCVSIIIDCRHRICRVLFPFLIKCFYQNVVTQRASPGEGILGEDQGYPRRFFGRDPDHHQHGNLSTSIPITQ
jgi:hypothetical protein